MSSEIQRFTLTAFEIDCFESGHFAGYTFGESWNGWACPRFSRGVAFAIMDAHRTMTTPAHAWYDEARDAFCFVPDDIPVEQIDRDNPPEETDVFEGFDQEGKHLYAIGAWGWCWNDAGRIDIGRITPPSLTRRTS